MAEKWLYKATSHGAERANQHASCLELSSSTGAHLTATLHTVNSSGNSALDKNGSLEVQHHRMLCSNTLLSPSEGHQPTASETSFRQQPVTQTWLSCTRGTRELPQTQVKEGSNRLERCSSPQNRFMKPFVGRYEEEVDRKSFCLGGKPLGPEKKEWKCILGPGRHLNNHC